MSKLAYPELKRYKVNDGFACATIATGSPLAVLIPPSMALILYGMITETSIAKLFAAGMLPGAASIIAMMALANIRCRLNPSLCPKSDVFTLGEKIRSLKQIIPVLILFVLVLGSIYMGIATPTEAGALGALVTFIIALFRGELTPKTMFRILKESAVAFGFVIFLLTGTFTFIQFIALSRIPFVISSFVIGLALPPGIVLVAVALMYIFAGMFLPQIPLLALTVPIMAPAMVALGFDIIWFAIFVVMMQSLGTVTPPVGLNIFIISGITKVPVVPIFKKAIPYGLADLAVIVLICVFPQIVLWIPNML
jgi:tripartite ATP-independent transporter DctM subunit